MALQIYSLTGKNTGDLIPITDALHEQEQLFQSKTRTVGPDTNDYIFFAEHVPVYTYVVHKVKNINEVIRDINEGDDALLPFPLMALNRAGSITFHGPGQIVCYFVIDLKNLKIPIPQLCKMIDSALIQTLARFRIHSFPKPEHVPEQGSGVWVRHENEFKKIASRGIKIRGQINGITQFGYALNVNTDLSYFDHIYPCGLDIQMASMELMTQEKISVAEVVATLTRDMKYVFEKK